MTKGKQYPVSKHSTRKEKKPMDDSKKKESRAGAFSSGSSRAVSTIVLPGPHGSISVRALKGSPFVDICNNSYILRNGAYMKEVFGAGGTPLVVMNSKMSLGVLIRPNERQARFDYPDGTCMLSIPICDVRILSLKTIYKRGMGREYVHKASEVYGRDSVMMELRTRIFDTIKYKAYKLFKSQYANDEALCVGTRSQMNPSISIANALVRPGANVISEPGCKTKQALADVLDENGDFVGDVLLSLRYIRDLGSRRAELVLEVQDVVLRTTSQASTVSFSG